jgi:Tol biopolymer transport system component/DNA-binding winged helix-turn-helix (wHTH) protein
MASAPKSANVIRFGLFEVDLHARELRKSGVKLKIHEQPFQVLIALLERPGEVVSREELRRKLWQAETFVDYDHSINTAVNKLREALGDSADNPRFVETLARRGYRFLASVNGATSEASAAPRATVQRKAWLTWALACAATLILVGVGVGLRLTRPAAHTESRTVPLTTFSGWQIMPAFASDGKQVAFTWNGEKHDNFDIYVKLVNAGVPLRVTSNSADEFFPAWSPDNRDIAFCRSVSGHCEIWLVPALGGTERKLGESGECRGLSWSPNGKSLALVDRKAPQEPFFLSLLSVETGEKRRLSSPPDRSVGDFSPRFSPDGKTVSFLRASSAVSTDVYVLAVNPDGTPGGDPRRLTSRERIYDLDWTADGQRIVYSSDHYGGPGLWTILVSGGSPERLSIAGENARDLAVSRSGGRLVYSRHAEDANIWRTPGPTSPESHSASAKFIASTQLQIEAQFSPDGEKIVFNSNRSGTWELWVCDREGHNFAQLTSLSGPSPGSPRWSPDSRWVAFDCPKAGNSDIYVISADGGPLRQMTTEPSADVRPSWSRDGRWIYFGSNRTGGWDIWKSPARGGRAVQVTKNKGAKEAFESLDGKFVYYDKGAVPGIWRVPVAGGEETRVLDRSGWSIWALARQGICFFDLTHPAGPTLEFYDFATRRERLLRQFSKEIFVPANDTAISVSEDGRWILYTQIDHAGSDLILVENFAKGR